MKTSKFPLIHNGGDGSVHPPPMRHKNHTRNGGTKIKSEVEKSPRNVGATRDCIDWTDTRNGGLDKANQEFKGARNGSLTTDHEDSKHTRNGGFVRELTPDTRKL